MRLMRDDSRTLRACLLAASLGLGEDLAGELYVTSFDGNVYKLVPP